MVEISRVRFCWGHWELYTTVRYSVRHCGDVLTYFVILILKIKRSIEDGGIDTFMSVSNFWLKNKGMMCKSVSSKQVDLQKKKKKICWL